MKVEYDSQEFDRTLQIEVHILTKLKQSKDVLNIIDCGKRKHYTYMVTTLCGKDLMALKLKIQRGFNDTTAMRVALFTLYGLKQLHEVGFVHRDVKPGNIMTAANRGHDSRFLILIDFGMARSFVITGDDGRKKLRPMRRKIPLRGTVRYCSMNVHERTEQGRSDDLIAMIYTIIFLTIGLPWAQIKNENEIMSMKKSTKDATLFEFQTIRFQLMTAINRLKINFLDPYEWEDEEIEKMAKVEQEEKEEKEKEKQREKEMEKKKEKEKENEKEKEKEEEKKVDKEKEYEMGKEKQKENDLKRGQMETAKSAKSTDGVFGEADEEKKLKVKTSDEQQKTSNVDICNKLHSAKDLASSHSDANENSQMGSVTKTGDRKHFFSKFFVTVTSSAVPGHVNDMETAIDYDQSEYRTKKALPSKLNNDSSACIHRVFSEEELQFVVYPAIAPNNFTEVIIPF
ncbi:hypothetical protein CRE_28380 [Caenorhabditis remanei]|uniref:non-specific serine/threonine protein kinase n=1 Tax=Caenorhabditis remanei TaxID=31234 RepID=E3LM19_CAERE|nr:hypothetical protein CRE_28380 [Caenorhabditis remanei]